MFNDPQDVWAPKKCVNFNHQVLKPLIVWSLDVLTLMRMQGIVAAFRPWRRGTKSSGFWKMNTAVSTWKWQSANSLTCHQQTKMPGLMKMMNGFYKKTFWNNSDFFWHPQWNQIENRGQDGFQPYFPERRRMTFTGLILWTTFIEM